MRPAASHHLPDSPFADFHLRAVSVNDAAALAALLQQLAPDEPRADAKLLALRLSELPVSRVVLVAERDGQLVGLAHYLFHRHCWRIEDVCYLQDLYVDPEARGTGLGRALIEAVYARADAAGADCGAEGA